MGGPIKRKVRRMLSRRTNFGWVVSGVLFTAVLRVLNIPQTIKRKREANRQAIAENADLFIKNGHGSSLREIKRRPLNVAFLLVAGVHLEDTAFRR